MLFINCIRTEDMDLSKRLIPRRKYIFTKTVSDVMILKDWELVPVFVLRPNRAKKVCRQVQWRFFSSRNPDLLAQRAGGFLAEIDTQELQRAARVTGEQLADALSRNPAVIKPLLKAAASVLGTAIKGYFKGMRARRRTRGVQ